MRALAATSAEGVVLGFGPHLVFDGYGCPSGPLEDLDGLRRMLELLPDRIHMARTMAPCVFRHGEPGDRMAGISGFVLIAEDHVCLHTFPARRYVNVDVFSSESFDVEDALAVLKAWFNPRRPVWKLLDRGLEFPKHLGRSAALVASNRRMVAQGVGLEASR